MILLGCALDSKKTEKHLLLQTAERETEVTIIRAVRRVHPRGIEVEVVRNSRGNAATRPIVAIDACAPQETEAHGGAAAAHEMLKPRKIQFFEVYILQITEVKQKI